ncbi:response regulator [Spirosoma sp. KNUC1025]|uniref:response regulator n=1 Tax=Spirosoma sp. KNUC1025 TaxID=2894082 RepID=UPI00386A2136|nr:response regulator [Spirosoma sp. KNUC1025]
MEATESLSIFIVDDDPFCRSFYEQHIRNLGYDQITIFSDGQECLNQLTAQPDVILLDYSMEPLNGLDVLRKIKRFNPDIYLVIVSGQEELQVAVNALKYGAFDYIIKGNNDLAKIEAVLKKIQEVMALLQQQQAQNRWKKLFSRFGTI